MQTIRYSDCEDESTRKRNLQKKDLKCLECGAMMYNTDICHRKCRKCSRKNKKGNSGIRIAKLGKEAYSSGERLASDEYNELDEVANLYTNTFPNRQFNRGYSKQPQNYQEEGNNDQGYGKSGMKKRGGNENKRKYKSWFDEYKEARRAKRKQPDSYPPHD